MVCIREFIRKFSITPNIDQSLAGSYVISTVGRNPESMHSTGCFKISPFGRNDSIQTMHVVIEMLLSFRLTGAVFDRHHGRFNAGVDFQFTKNRLDVEFDRAV